MKNHLKTKTIIILTLIFFTQLDCYKITSSFKRVIYSGHLQKPVDPERLTLGSDRDYRVFQRTPVWDLAYALAVGDLGEVEELAKKHNKIINTPEPKYGTTLLSYAIRNGQINAVKILLSNGANPNVSAKPPESLKNTPIANDQPGSIMNPGYPDDYNDYKNYTPVHAAVATSPEMLRIILKNGGDPNLHSDLKYSHTDEYDYSYTITGGYSPLMYAKDIDTLKLLVEGGGNIHLKNKYGGSLLLQKYSVYDRLDQILYLLEQGVDYQGVLNYYGGYNDKKPKEDLVPHYLVDKLRFKVFGLESDWYRQKIQIVQFLSSKGIDYWKTPIPMHALNEIDRISKTNKWSESKKQEFISKY
ncbi:MAG: ankyrin repeat domain-containing protein [Leptospiraceae bacterium]|nr:ankyrin repeat domain-containing protein [Leptospiraceae bacterium]